MRSRTPDRLCAEAVDVALAATLEAADPDTVGVHLEVVAEGDRVVTHFFACSQPAYRGWRWATTLARASRAKLVTVGETVLLPGDDAVLAPEWVPWSERLRPGDMGPGDLLPTEADDLRLEPGWAGEPGWTAEAGWPAEPDWTGEPGRPGEPGGTGADEPPAAEEPAAEDAEPVVVPSVATIGAIAGQLGMGRPRVLSRYGLHAGADRWEEEFGAKTPMAQAAPANCVSCGFLVPMAGSLSQAFGVCANEFSPADGRVVSLGYGCGGHSEAAVMPRPQQPAPMVLDELHDTDPLPLGAAAARPSAHEGEGEDEGGPGE